MAEAKNITFVNFFEEVTAVTEVAIVTEVTVLKLSLTEHKY